MSHDDDAQLISSGAPVDGQRRRRGGQFTIASRPAGGATSTLAPPAKLIALHAVVIAKLTVAARLYESEHAT